MIKSSRAHGLGILLVFVLIVIPQAQAQSTRCTNKYEICPVFEFLCSSETPAFKLWMNTNCMKTCGLCKKNTTVWTAWSICTKTCGIGTRYRKRCRNVQCELEYQACSTWSCPIAVCPARSYQRHGIKHECCRKDGALCGQPVVGNRLRKRRFSIGGINAQSAKTWPWMVVVYAPGYEFCGGVILNEKFVLSAAHCFFGEFKRRNTSLYKIYYGILKLSKGRSRTAKSIKKLIVHPDYAFPANDLAIIELSTSLKYRDEVMPICLPGDEETPKDTTCYMTGWGVSIRPGFVTDHLQKVALQIFDPQVCMTTFEKYNEMKYVMPFVKQGKNYLCAGSLYKINNSCKGDSGSALVCQRCSSCTWYLAGTVAFGLPDCHVKGVPGVYMKIKSFENWIINNTDVRKPSKKVCLRKIGP